MTNFYFRVDGHSQIGFGHLARCSYIAATIEKKDFGQTHFIVSEDTLIPSFLEIKNIHRISFKDQVEEAEKIQDLISSSNNSVLILDSYTIDSALESKLKDKVKCLVVFDDLANRNHSCDILVDCGHQRKGRDYITRVPLETSLLIGLNFCFIPDKTIALKKGNVTDHKRIHLFFGGGVAESIILDYFDFLKTSLPGYFFNVGFSHKLSEKSEQRWLDLKSDMDHIFLGVPLTDSLKGCGLAIGSPGISTWERCFLEIPSFYISTNKNQAPILTELSALGICQFGGDISEELPVMVNKIRQFILSDESDLMRKRLTGIVDGKGTERIIDEIRKKV